MKRQECRCLMGHFAHKGTWDSLDALGDVTVGLRDVQFWAYCYSGWKLAIVEADFDLNSGPN